MALTVRPAELRVLLVAAITAHENVLVTGAPGIGKTDIVQQAAAEAGADLIVSHPAVEDPTDAKGLPWPGNGKKDEATFLPFGNLAKAIKATSLTCWDLEDLGQATTAVQAAYMQLLKDSAGKLSKHVTFVASTNRRTDRAGVTGILEPVKSRFGTIVELEAHIDDWSDWAIKNGIPINLIAFLKFRPDLLSAFTPSADLTNSPMPRTWAALARIEAMNLPQAIEAAAMAGAVGEGAAGEYLAFRAMAKQIQSVDSILMNVKKAKIPTDPSQLYATVVALASRANDVTFPTIVEYANRLVTEAQRGDFGALLMRDIIRRDEDGELQHSDTFVRMSLSPVGKLLDGRE